MRKMIFSALVLSLTFAIGCAKTEESTSDVSFTSTTSPAPTPTPAATGSAPGGEHTVAALMARSATGDSSVVVALSGDPSVEITETAGTRKLTSNQKESGKRKYYDSSGTQIAEVKPSDSGFKVRSVSGDLYWKVKIADDKIKISDNEENLHPWVLKTGYPDKAKIVDPNESEIGVVRFAKAPAPTRIRSASGSDEWTIESDSPSAAWGVLMMSSVSRDHQAIIIAELLARGR